MIVEDQLRLEVFDEYFLVMSGCQSETDSIMSVLATVNQYGVSKPPKLFPKV